MSKIRVLIVDDSVVIRRMLSDYLSSDPDIEVAGTAPDGKIALAKISQLNPDLIILDIEMPVMDGLQTLAAIRKNDKALPVIMFSTLTDRGASVTLDALSLGASDYATKSTSGESARHHVVFELIPKIKALCHRRTALAKSEKGGPKCEAIRRFAIKSSSTTPIDIVTIGVSTGGPNALAKLLTSLEKDFPVPVVIVQHMPQMFTRMLAERLARLTGFLVREGRAGETLRAGEIWIAPGGFHMEVDRVFDGVKLRTHEGPFENSCRPAVDVLFRSVAKAYGPRVLGVMLTGMGQDGLRGCENIVEAGGRVLAQDEATSVVWGMPGAIVRAGLAEKTLPLPEIAPEIDRLVRSRPAPVSKVRSSFDVSLAPSI